MTPQDFRFSHSLRVRWVEVDMQKIVFNGHYLMYFDTAIADYWRALGLPYEEAMQQLGGDLYVKKASVEYHGSARFDDRLEVALKCARIGNSSLTFSGAIFRDGVLLVSCELIYVFADPVAQTSKPVPSVLRELLDRFEAGGDMVRIETGDWQTLGGDATTLRTAVFAQEQGIALNLMSDAADATSLHAVAYNGLGQAVATGRLIRAGKGSVRSAGWPFTGRYVGLASARRSCMHWLMARSSAETPRSCCTPSKVRKAFMNAPGLQHGARISKRRACRTLNFQAAMNRGKRLRPASEGFHVELASPD